MKSKTLVSLTFATIASLQTEAKPLSYVGGTMVMQENNVRSTIFRSAHSILRACSAARGQPWGAHSPARRVFPAVLDQMKSKTLLSLTFATIASLQTEARRLSRM